MKRTALAGLIICAAVLASPVFADETIPAKDDLCAINLEKINTYLSGLPTTSENTLDDLKATYEKAKTEQANGNNKACEDLTTGEVARISTLKESQNK